MNKKIFFIFLVICGIALASLNFFFFRNDRDVLSFLFVVVIILVVLPYVIFIFVEAKIQKEKESKFLEFARDLVEGVHSGTPISKAIMNLRRRDYGALTPHVQKLANQLTLGIPLTNGMINFASDVDSKVISRAVGLISEAERSGGEIDFILNSVANSISQIEQLKKERTASVYNLIVQGYIIFFVFIVIVLVLQYYILPMTEGAGRIEGVAAELAVNQNADFSRPLLALLLVQSFFAGLVIGKISEGSFKEGIRHSFILITVALLVSFGAKLFFG